ncbi:CGNR zinc finger domain-containing protein [Candidatus Bathyarchaeota archaeon]|nr:CGNR zinc finger domain-containing protein [Candidatus Bathyarchaeota archaeon]
MPINGEIVDMNRVGGRLCLDFVNTVDWRGRQERGEYLNDYLDLLIWSRHVGILSESEYAALEKASLINKEEAEKVYRRAIDYRETIYRAFSCVASGTEPHVSDIRAINEELTRASTHRKLIKTENGYSLGFDDEPSLDRMLWQISSSVIALLTSTEPNRVKRCGSEECGWLFYDTSRNRSRKWCDMKECGNRMKAKRHYSRTTARSL